MNSDDSTALLIADSEPDRRPFKPVSPSSGPPVDEVTTSCSTANLISDMDNDEAPPQRPSVAAAVAMAAVVGQGCLAPDALENRQSPKNEQKTELREIVEPTWKVLLRGAAPHLGLLTISLIYTFIGAAVFISLEEPHSRQVKRETMARIQLYGQEMLENLYELRQRDQPVESGYDEFNEFAARLHNLHKSKAWSRADLDSHPDDRETGMEDWNFSAAVFFVLTTLTTIGYGNVVPATRAGRIFCMCYGLIGVPLLLITTADVAKFMSSGLTRLYIRYLKWKAKAWEKLSKLIWRRNSQTPEADDTESMAEYVWNNVDSVHYVKVHASIMLVIILSYASIGGWLYSLYEDWTFFDAFYFSFISILKVGFGDMLPKNHRYAWLSMLYVFFGLTVATMCVDIAGSQYLERIHQLGRQMKDADYLRVIQRAKYKRKRREAMRSLMTLLTLVSRMHIPPVPPAPPKDVRVTSITPYSIRLIWTPPSSAKVKYVLRYRMKHSKSESTVNISNISDGEFEVRNLKSFSIYEISLASINKVGRSNSVRLIQITEPESSPQDLAVEQLTATSVRLTWKPPYKKRKDVKKYAVYYNRDPDQPFERWTKVVVDNGEFSLKLDQLIEGAGNYAFCISSVYDRGHSPISRAVYVSSQGNRKISGATTFSGVTVGTDTGSRDENANTSYSTNQGGKLLSDASYVDVPL